MLFYYLYSLLKHLKKLLAFILICIFLYNQAGYLIAFKLRQQEIRSEMKSRIKRNVPEQELTAIRIEAGNESALDWEKEDKEFEYKGNLFDVVRKESVKGATIYYCINDAQEEKLFDDLDEHVRRHMNDTPVNEKQQLKAMKDYFAEELYTSPVTTCSFIKYPITHEAADTRFAPPSSPPPESV